jgi:hypothetical protein
LAGQKSTILSLPALAAALRTTGQEQLKPAPSRPFTARELVPMYRIGGRTASREIQDAVHVIEQLTDRLHRLADAYGEWQEFDAGAYFDLSPHQVQGLIHLTERVATVHITISADLLLPSFRRAATYWAAQYSAAYAALFVPAYVSGNAPAYDDDFLLDTQPDMQALWQRTRQVITATRSALKNDAAFLSTDAISEEQARWRSYWTEKAGRGIDPALLPPVHEVPTLTLSHEFPLPPSRQSGRVRRLRRHRDRRQRHRRLRPDRD